MAVIQDININVYAQPSEKRLRTFLTLSQNENGRLINFRILGAPLPSNCVATFSGTKPDGNVYSTTGTVTGNFVVVAEDMQMTAVAGVWDAKLDIINGTHNIMTALIRVVVDADVVDPDAIASDSQLQGLVAEAKYYAEEARIESFGAPLTAALKADMLDHTRVYVYTGSESGMTAGHWYYWNGSAWTDGGVYNAAALDTDKTLSVPDKAADGKATGDALALKVDKVTGKGLSTNDYTTAEKTKLSGIAEGATKVEIDTTLSTAGKAADAKKTGDEISELKEDLNDYVDGYVHILESDFSRGSLNNDGTINAGQSYYASTNKDMVFDRPVKISVKSGYKYIYREKTGDSAYNSSGWITTDRVVASGKAFKLQVGRVTETWGAADLGIFSSQINVTSEDSTSALFNSAQIDQLKNGNELLVFAFARGSVTGTGEYVSYVNYRVATPDIISYGRDITITSDDGFEFSGCTYDQSGTLIESWGSWMTERKVTAGQRIRLVIIRSTEDTSEVADVFEYYTKIHIQSEFKDYVNAVTANPNTALLAAPIFANGRAKLIAHMGYHATAPENTTEAYKEAGKKGYWGIESDVQQTSDGYYVMCHDSTVDRTTNGTGNINEMTLAEIRALHIKDRSDLQVPTLEEYLSICKRYGCVPNIELKGTVTNTKASYEKIIAIVKQFAFSDKSVVFCGSKWALSNFRQATQTIPFMAIYQYNSSYNWGSEFAFCSAYDNVGMCWDIDMGLTIEQCKQAHDNDMIIDAFITDTESDVANAFSAGADFVTTNTITPTE